jgi:hypothetical protein
MHLQLLLGLVLVVLVLVLLLGPRAPSKMHSIKRMRRI